MNLKIISFNCQSLRSNFEIISDLTKNCDVLCLQETLIDDNNHHFLDQIDENFMCAYVPSVRKADCFVGRSSGGLAVLWRRGLNLKFSAVKYGKRILGLKIFPNNGDSPILVLNVYMPCDYGNENSYLEYKSCLADIVNILNSDIYNDVCIVGDLNADPNKGRYFTHLSDFMDDNNLFLSDINSLPSDSYTYVSSNHACTCSWLDHVCVSNPNLVSDHDIFYGSTVFDHIPIFFNLRLSQFDVHINYENIPKNEIQFNFKWDSITDEQKMLYSDKLDELSLELSYDVLRCRNTSCNNTLHKSQLDRMYGEIIDTIILASENLPRFKGRHNKSVVGWNAYCKGLYRIARDKYLLWHNIGKPRVGTEFEEMKISRTAFKNALNFCRNNEKQLKHEILLDKFSNSNKTLFWKEIGKVNGSGSRNIVELDSETSIRKHVEIFDEKYKKILNDPICQIDCNDPVLNPTVIPRPIPFITLDVLCESIMKLNKGLGWDEIHSNHLKFSGPIFLNLLCKFLNMLISHSHIPMNLIYGEIRPVIKNKVLGKTDSNNYRPVLNSSMFLKVIEYCLLPVLTENLKLSSHQYGFRKETGCLSAIAMVKETIYKYNSENSNVHCVFVDLSKAFDRINHKILFSKLVATELHPKIVDLLRAMYDDAYVHTLFNGLKGVPWKIGNGARQGGILSPLIFSYYIDNVLKSVSEMNIGCSIIGHKTSVIAYADDLVLLAPSASGVQKMLNKLCEMLGNLCMTVNVSKSNYIVFKKRKNYALSFPNIVMNGEILAKVEKVKYLGVILNENGLDVHDDIDRISTSFLKQFNAMYSKFNFVSNDIMYFLFKSYTSSFYGIDVWFDRIPYSRLRRVSVPYHKAVKRICNMNVWDSNHDACDLVGVLTFKHIHALRLVCFWHKLCQSKSMCLGNLNYYFRFNSCIYRKLKSMFLEAYSVDISRNPLCSIKSRIKFVHNHEPRSHYAHSL